MITLFKQLLPSYPHIRSDYLISGLIMRHDSLREWYAQKRLKHKGEGAKVDFKSNIIFANNVSIGKKVKVQNNTIISAGVDNREVIIEDYALVGAAVLIVTSTYDVKLSEKLIRDIPPLEGPVKIESGAFIGWGSVIYPNVTIGEKAVIAPYSIVKEDVPPKTYFNGSDVC